MIQAAWAFMLKKNILPCQAPVQVPGRQATKTFNVFENIGFIHRQALCRAV
jgi:hypothetical protein